MLNARVCAWNKIYRVEWLKKIGVIFPKGLLYEDVCFFCKIVPYLTQLPVTVHLPLYHYRQREGSILSSSNRRIMEIHKIFADVFVFYNEKNLGAEFEEIVECKYVKTVFCSFLMRMLKMKDKKIRKEVIQESWEVINTERPNWKRNRYLKKMTPRNIYLKMMSKCRIIDITKHQESGIRGIGPCEFLDLFSNCQASFVDSFHGTVFSILFGKQFLTFSRPNEVGYGNMNSCFETILGMLGLENHYVNSITDTDKIYDAIDYKEVHRIIQSERAKAEQYLRKALVK